MPRLPRFFVPDTPLHVIQRGNNRVAMFRNDLDYSFMCAWIQRAASKHGVAIHAYVLMTNHIHVLATPRAATSLPRTMQALGRAYVRYFNESYERTGTLFEGRYKAAIVDNERYLLACMRYIELNPVRAGLARTPADYPWSSFRANAFGSVDPLLTPHPVYVGLSGSDSARRRLYRELFDTALTPVDLDAIRDSTQNGWAMGSAAFRRRVSELARRSERLPTGRPSKTRCNPAKLDSDPHFESKLDSDPN